jgi:HEAT repeat protein
MITKTAAIEAEPVDTRIRAIRFLIENAPSDKVLPLLEELLDSLAPAVRKEAIVGLGKLGHRPAVERLCSLAASADPETAAVLASALAKIGDSAAEPALLTLLEREEEGQKIAVVSALGHVGTAAAVEPLMDLTGRVLSSELGRAAEEAIARIQSRLGDVEAGRLTLAELTEHEGALSLSREGGELSLSNGGQALPHGDEGDTEESS